VLPWPRPPRARGAQGRDGAVLRHERLDGARRADLLDEILGYHLEQAYRYRAELGPLDSAAAAIAERAATRLLGAADRSLERGDTSATVRLLSRATELMPQTDARRPLAELELATALGEQGELEGAIELLNGVAAAAREHGVARVVERARIARLWFDMQTGPELRMSDVLAEAHEALAALERIGDDEGAMLALRVIGAVTGWRGNSTEAQVHWRRALERAEHAGNRFVDDILAWMLLGGWWGRTTAPETIRLADEALALSSSKRLEAYAHVVGGAAVALSGRVDGGRERIAAGRALFQDPGDVMAWAGITALVAEVELVAGEPQRAHDALSAAAAALAASSETGYRATTVSFQAHAALDLGRLEESAGWRTRRLRSPLPMTSTRTPGATTCSPGSPPRRATSRRQSGGWPQLRLWSSRPTS
jgi:tetratricopeptide (TPR) repeat protein